MGLVNESYPHVHDNSVSEIHSKEQSEKSMALCLLTCNSFLWNTQLFKWAGRQMHHIIKKKKNDGLIKPSQ